MNVKATTLKKHLDSNQIEAPESDYLYIGISQLPNSGNGLFTAIDIYKDEIIAVFNGVVLTHKKAAAIINTPCLFLVSILTELFYQSLVNRFMNVGTNIHLQQLIGIPSIWRNPVRKKNIQKVLFRISPNTCTGKPRMPKSCR